MGCHGREAIWHVGQGPHSGGDRCHEARRLGQPRQMPWEKSPARQQGRGHHRWDLLE